MQEILVRPFRQPIAQPQSILNVCLSFQWFGDDVEGFQTFSLTISSDRHVTDLLVPLAENFLSDFSMAFALQVTCGRNDLLALLRQLQWTAFAEFRETFFFRFIPSIPNPSFKSMQLRGDPFLTDKRCASVASFFESDAFDSIDGPLFLGIISSGHFDKIKSF